VLTRIVGLMLMLHGYANFFGYVPDDL
jgi:hypothetical protein